MLATLAGQRLAAFVGQNGTGTSRPSAGSSGGITIRVTTMIASCGRARRSVRAASGVPTSVCRFHGPREILTLGEGMTDRDPASGDRAPSATEKTLLDRPAPRPHVAADSGPRARRPALGVGEKLDRFEVIGVLGGGGMGLVVSAYDPVLDRKVAIKLLHPESEGSVPTQGARQRLVREAQAMARISHPNVITVFEVGTAAEQVFIAMELVEGATLTAWLARRRPWREVAAVFEKAGQGLAAAHAAGLVHRDFKPDNVLIGDDGRVRVTDFGLVATRATAAGVGAQGRLSVTTPLDGTITLEGALLGTPAYMAPEQHERRAVDARTDQFAFCIALYEALFRRPAFAGESYDEFSANVCAGRVQAPAHDVDVPARLRSAVLRGLAPRSEDRHPSMQALLEALRPPPRRWPWVAVAAAGVAVVGGGAWMAARGASSPAVCRGAERLLAGVWDDALERQTRDAFAASGRPYAAGTFERIDRALDEWSDAWAAMHTGACEATRVHGEQSEALMDLRMACLDARRTQVAALTRLFARADAAVVDGAARAVTDLPRLDTCADITTLAAAFPRPADPAVRQAVDVFAARLDEVDALTTTGQYSRALEAAHAAVDDVAALDFPPSRARALALLGILQQRVSESVAAEATLRDAAQWAARARDDRLLARIYASLVLVVGYEQARYDDGLGLLTVARAAIERAGGDDLLEAQLLGGTALIHVQQAHHAQARDELARALPIVERARGPEHPDVARLLSYVSAAYEGEGNLRESLAYEERALAIRERALGAEHPDAAASLHNIAGLLGSLGDLEGASAREARALAIWQRVHGPDHPDVALAENAIGNIRWQQKRHAEARAHFERGLRITQETLGGQHPSVASFEFNLGELGNDQGQPELAVHHCARGRVLFVASKGPDHPGLGEFDSCLARAHLRAGRLEQARASAEQGLTLLVAGESSPAMVATARFTLAQALVLLGRERTRALELARVARAEYVKSYGEGHLEVTEVDAWLGQIRK